MQIAPSSVPYSRRGVLSVTKSLAVAVSFSLLANVLLPAPVRAFKPNLIARLEDDSHEDITREAIETVITSDFRQQINFGVRRAIQEIGRGNSGTDLSLIFFDAKYHFDGDSFRAAQNLLAIQIRRIKFGLKEGNLGGARLALGQALHTLQDFYAHSNWIETKHSSPHPEVGVLNAAGRAAIIQNTSSPEDGIATCRTCVPDTSPNDCGLDCRDNWVGGLLTTGYFALFVGDRPLNKCSHGGCNDVTAEGWGGINKDGSDPNSSPHHHLHRKAADVAREATEGFIRNLRDSDKVGEANALTEAELKRLLGVSELTVTLVVDVEDNDYTAIYGDYARRVLENLRDAADAPTQLTLVAFDRQRVRKVVTKKTIDEMFPVVENLDEEFAESEGSAGPRNVFAALSHAVLVSQTFANMVLFTEGSVVETNAQPRAPADGVLLKQVAEQARLKGIRIYPMIEGTSGFDFQLRAIHPDYVRIADLTSAFASLYCSCIYTDEGEGEGEGELDEQVFRALVKDFEYGVPLPLFAVPPPADFSSDAPPSPGLYLADAVWGTRSFSSAETEFVLIDPSISSVKFTGANLASITVKRPDETEVTKGSPGVEYIEFDDGASITVSDPQPGLWTVTTQEHGQPRSVRVAAHSLLDDPAADFMEAAGVGPHRGGRPVSGEPVAGQSVIVEATLDHEVSSAGLELRDQSGAVLVALPLTADTDGGRSRVVSDIITPSEPFSKFITGTDLAGQPFMRRLPGVVTPQTLSLQVPSDIELRPGRDTEVEVSVHNFGTSNTFRLTVTDDKGYLRTTGPFEIALDQQETRALTLTLRTPPGATVGGSVSLSLRAVGIDGAAENYAVVKGFIVEPHAAVKGRLTDGNGVGVQGAVVTLSSADRNEFALTDAAGMYEFDQLMLGVNYTVTPTHEGFNFSPDSRLAELLSADVVADFTAPETRQLQSAEATPAAVEGGPPARLEVIRSGVSSGYASVGYETADGTARAESDYVMLRGTLIFAPGETRKVIEIPVRDDAAPEPLETVIMRLTDPVGAVIGLRRQVIVAILDDDSGTVPANPIDDTQFFVLRHYLDFLNREPDASGLTHWTNVANNCGESDLLVCRVNVSGAFFLSIEFQQTGYLVGRIYKTSYGDATGTSTLGGTPHTLTVPVVRFEEFLPDTQRIGQGVVVLAPGWEAQLEANKVAFTQEFVQRARFLDSFPTTMTPTDFVDRLNGRARGPLDANERQALIDELSANNTTAGRASVLRKVAEDPTLEATEKNRAFVLMQYFGYLRRNPNDLPDSDYTGYDFWLGNLEKAGGNFVQAELVKAFISSLEYRQRFGQ